MVREDERALLSPWCEAFARCFGEAPRLSPMSPVEAAPEAGREAGLEVGPEVGHFCLTWPRLEPAEVIGQTGHFAQSGHLGAHVRALGFEWDDVGRICAAPTPATFNERLARLAGDDTGYRVEVTVEDQPTMSLGPWLDRYLDGVIPIHVCTRDHYLAFAERPAVIRWQLTTLVHDLSVHALNYHLVPRRLARRLGARIRSALPERASSWSGPAAAAPLTLAYFFDNDLNRYCYAVWSACDAPSGFAPAFERHLAQLEHALDVRIGETREGKGDVPSGNSDDMPPLTPTEFTIPRR